MENVYQHLVRIEGKERADRLVHWMVSYLRIGKEYIDRSFILEMREMVPMIGYQASIDELANLYRQSKSLEDFIKETSEDQLSNIILDFEKWDNRPEEVKFFDIIDRCLRQ